MLSCFVSLETNPRQLASFLAPLAVPVPRPPIFCSLGNVPARSATRHHPAGDEKQSPPSSSKTRPYALPVNCDARNSFRFRSYANCRVSLALCALFARSFHSLLQECFTTLLQSNGSALFLKTAGWYGHFLSKNRKSNWRRAGEMNSPLHGKEAEGQG